MHGYLPQFACTQNPNDYGFCLKTNPKSTKRPPESDDSWKYSFFPRPLRIEDRTTDFVYSLPFLSHFFPLILIILCCSQNVVQEHDFTLCMRFLPWLRSSWSSWIVAQKANETTPPTIINLLAKTEPDNKIVLYYLLASQVVLIQLLVSG